MECKHLGLYDIFNKIPAGQSDRSTPGVGLFLLLRTTVSRMAEISAGIPGGDRQRVEAASSKSEVWRILYHGHDQCEGLPPLVNFKV